MLQIRVLQSFDEGTGPAAHKVLQLVKARMLRLATILPLSSKTSACHMNTFCWTESLAHTGSITCVEVVMTTAVSCSMDNSCSVYLAYACPQMLVSPGITYVSSKADSLLLEKLRAGLGPDPAADAFDVRLEKSSLFNLANVCGALVGVHAIMPICNPCTALLGNCSFVVLTGSSAAGTPFAD